MAEAQNYTFDYKEIAEELIRRQGIHEGLWGIYMEFGIAGANAGPTEGTILPVAVVPVLKVGIQRFDIPNNLTVDAAEVNPMASKSLEVEKKKQGRRSRTR